MSQSRSLSYFLESPIEGCKHFYWKEALLLREIDLYCLPTPELEKNIIEIAQKAELIRSMLKTPMFIVSWLRPGFYNTMIGGAPGSWHKTGGAIDFKCMGVSADAVRDALRPKLHDLGLRMENLPGSNWVHVDTKPVDKSGERFFKP